MLKNYMLHAVFPAKSLESDLLRPMLSHKNVFMQIHKINNVSLQEVCFPRKLVVKLKNNYAVHKIAKLF